MIVRHCWKTKRRDRTGKGFKITTYWCGWFLFGIIPLYITYEDK